MLTTVFVPETFVELVPVRDTPTMIRPLAPFTV
jgi:hypothetical protein